MSLRDAIIEHQRLCILRLLAAARDYKLNDSLIRASLGDLGLGASRDELRALLAWLDEQRLLTLDIPVPTALVATLTDRGLDVAEGRANHPGVHRPGPSALARNALRSAAGLPPEE